MSAPLPVVLVRHGRTGWNAEGRIQGHSDIPLSDAGRAEVAGWRLPEAFAGFAWTASPLARARDTALILGAPPDALALDRRLREIHWGAWEGCTMDDLRDHLPLIRRARAEGGLDFCAPGGETNRELQARLVSWLGDVAARGRPTVAVAHQGVIRALLALATGWDMRGPPPSELQWAAAHLFHLGEGRRLAVGELNIALAAPARRAAP